MKRAPLLLALALLSGCGSLPVEIWESRKICGTGEGIAIAALAARLPRPSGLGPALLGPPDSGEHRALGSHSASVQKQRGKTEIRERACLSEHTRYRWN